MKLEDILTNNSDTTLTKQELELLKKEQYIINESTPDRIVKSKNYMEWVAKKYPREVSEYILNRGNIVIDDYNYRAFSCNEELLKRSLLNNYKNTINILVKHGSAFEMSNDVKRIFLDNSFVVSNEMTYFIYNNPGLINISLKNDYKKTIEFLKEHSNILLREEDRKEFREILINNDYVLTAKDLELACVYHDFIYASLAKDPLKTLSTRSYALLDSIKDNQDLYIECLIHLENIFMSKHSKENKDKLKEMVGVFNVEKELLFSCLENKESYSIFLSNLDGAYSKVNLDDKDAKRLAKILNDNNFKLIDHPSLARVNFNFFLASLENDFDSTVRVLKNAYDNHDVEFLEDFVKDDISEEEYQRYKEVILKQDILQVDSFLMYADYRALRVLSEKDVNMAAIMLGVRYDEETLIDIPSKQALPILKNILAKKKDLVKSNFFEDTYFRLRNLIVEIPSFKYSNEFNEKDVDAVVSAFNEDILSMSMISSNYFTHKEVMDKLKINMDTKILLEKSALKKYTYDQKDEYKLLKILHKDNLEEHIVSLKDKNRSELSIEDMLAIKMYALKVLKNNGLNDYSVEVFDYSKDKDTYGCENKDLKRVSLYNGHNRSVYNMIKTLHHEINHAIQFKNIEEANFEDDYDINYYAKDEIIKEILGDEYYKDNYDYFSYEFDTEFKAKLLTDAFFGLDNGKKSVEEKKASLSKIESSLKYYHSIERIDSSKRPSDLDSIFERVVDKYYIELLGVDEFRRKYKSLTYEYEVTMEGLRKYSLEELVEFINKGEDKDRYLAILKNKINPSRDKKFQDNLEELNKLYWQKRISEEVARELSLSKTSSAKEEFNKYLSYLDTHFDRITKVFSRRSVTSKKK